MFSLPYPAADETLPKITWSWLNIWGRSAHSANPLSVQNWWLPLGKCWDKFDSSETTMKQAQYGRLPQYFKDHKSGANCNLGLILT
jgi:hypothetical protein